jgi:hypothetical protein
MILALSLSLCVGIGGCEEPTAVVRPPHRPPELLVQGPPSCGQLQFTIVSSSAATVTFPSLACGTGLILIKAANPTWNGTTRILTLQVRVKNASGQSVNRPVRVELPDTGRVVLAPGGQLPTKITAETPDTLYPSGTGVWFAGTAGLLPAGDSTSIKQIKIKAASPVTSGQLNFIISTSEVIVGMPALAPNIEPAWFRHDSSFTPDGTSALKRVIAVAFIAGATVPQKQTAVDSVLGSVIGGSPWIDQAEEGVYYIHVPNAITVQGLDSAIVVLKRQASVSDAWHVLRMRPAGLPNDGLGWKVGDWTFAPDSSTGSNWALEDLGLPQAWSCAIGNSVATIGIADETFKTGDFKANVVGGIPLVQGDTDPWPHGNRMASIIAARGNNDTGMTGVNWKSALRLKATGYGAGGLRVGAAIDSLIKSGVGIINLSLATSTVDSATAKTAAVALFRSIRKHPLSQRPLFVIAAGNDNRDAVFASAPIIRDSMQGQVIVVGAAKPRVGSTRNRWGGASFATLPNSGSNWGSRVDLYAPGEIVPVWKDGSGSFESRNGTSLSAAFVSGIAGLLKSFDPSLTATQLKTLIMAGAVAGNRAMVNDPTRYLANAYESLKLAANQSGKPICGFPASLEGVWDEEYHVTLRRPAGDENVPLTGLASPNHMWAYVGFTLSVAPGGKTFAITRLDYDSITGQYGTGLEQYTLSGGSWGGVTIAGVNERYFLDQDTVDMVYGESDTPITVRGPHAKYLGDMNDVLEASALITYASTGVVAFSPDAKYALVSATIRTTSCSVVLPSSLIVTVQTLAVTLVSTPPCVEPSPWYVGTEGYGPSWSPYGDRFVTVAQDSGGTAGVALHFKRRKIVGGSITADGVDVEVSGRSGAGRDFYENVFAVLGRVEPDGKRMHYLEGTTSDCRQVIRSAFSPFSVISESVFTPWEGCQAFTTPPPGAPPAFLQQMAKGGRRISPGLERILRRQGILRSVK